MSNKRAKRNRHRGGGGEAASRERRIKNAAARTPRNPGAHDSPPPLTEAARILINDLTTAGHHALAARAAKLEFDEHYSPYPDHALALIQTLMLADLPQLVEHAKAGRYDATPADDAAYRATAKGKAEMAEFEQILAQLPHRDRARLETTMDKVASHYAQHPEQANREMDAFIGRMAQDMGLDEPAPDDDRHVTPQEIHASLRDMLGRTANGARMDTPEILAAAELALASKGNFEIDSTPPQHPPVTWQAQTTLLLSTGETITIASDHLPGPNAAARDLVTKLLTGSQCTTCGRVISLDPRGFVAADRTSTADGTVWSAQDQAEAGMCLWRRRGPHWCKGCAPLPD